jgi:pyruvate/2-oxoglutarate dehydrogenase complex dihydrolipoamide dehydrogenase (E3) component
MEAARVAALRGHKVALYEKADRLGGQLVLAAIAPHKEEVRNIVSYLSTQVHKLGVKVELRREVTPQLVEKLRPDVVIVATGASPILPGIPGLVRGKVVTAHDVLADKVEVGEKIVVVGGGMVGAETAEFLADRGKRVTIVRFKEMLADIALDVPLGLREHLLQRLGEKGVKVLANARVEEITGNGVTIIDREQKKQAVEADTIVIATRPSSNRELLESLRGKVPQLYAIGDCVEPRQAIEAIYEGSRTALEI